MAADRASGTAKMGKDLFGFGFGFIEFPFGDSFDCAPCEGAPVVTVVVACADAAAFAIIGFGLIKAVPNAGKSVVESNAGAAAGIAVSRLSGGALLVFPFPSIFGPIISPTNNDFWGFGLPFFCCFWDCCRTGFDRTWDNDLSGSGFFGLLLSTLQGVTGLPCFDKTPTGDFIADFVRVLMTTAGAIGSLEGGAAGRTSPYKGVF